MPTTYDVARLAGVSQMTVCRAFDEFASIRPETRQRILAAAAEIGYVHNRTASSLASRRHRAIGLILPTLQELIYLPVVDGARGACEARGVDVLLQAIDYDRAKERTVISSLLGQSVRAILIPSIGHSAETARLLRASPIPVIEAGNLPRRPIHFAVGHSDFEAGYTAGRHLTQSGRRSIAMICGYPEETSNSRDRLRGYRRALMEADLPVKPELIAFTDHSTEGAGSALERIRATGKKFDAILAAGEIWSPPVLLQLLKLGVRVPDDVAVIGVGQVPLGPYFPVSLSYVALPRFDTGRLAAELAMDVADGVRVERRVRKLPIGLIMGTSV